ncbi:TIGR02266 family protein [Corallococcus macrosporus]|uniref:Molecular chaperone DnaK n=1 Tax=Corallococcus macrosporus DSM 14697 TaxID=1189310 RepID=A0A250K3T5_9BACT|nr:TIGR02266 family protein [Corallococcus macrosporus]ATB50638.1 molecular chaperone DnaK [Corallococcus macrosporus DSM 14697]
MDQGRRTTDRKAVGLLVKLKHETVGSFAEEFATNLSPGGMFIRSRTPQAVGTPVKFEVQIAGGVRVLRGSALVRWVREVGDPSGPPGMGLQFEELDTASRALVEMMTMRKAVAEANGPAVQPLPSIAPSVAPSIAPSIAPAVAPAIAPSIAPAVAPARPAPVPPVQARPAPAPPRPVAAPARPADVGGMALDSLFDDLEPTGGSSAPVLDEPFDLAPPVVDEPLTPPPSRVPVSYSPPPPTDANDVDIPLDELIASTPPPSATSLEVDEPLPGFEFEIESPSGDAPVAMGAPLDEPPIEVGISLELEPAPSAPAGGGGLEFELDLGDAVAEPPRAPAPPPRVAPPPAPATSGGSFEFDLDLSDVEPAPPAPPPPPRAPVAPKGPPPAPAASHAGGGGIEFDFDLTEDAPPAPPVAPPPRAAAAPPPAPVSAGGVFEFDIALAGDAGKAPPPPPPSPRAPAPASSGGGSIEFDLDLSEDVEEAPPLAPPPPRAAPAAPPAPVQPPVAVRPPPPPPVAPPPPPGLPQVRREAPRAPEPLASPTVLAPAAAKALAQAPGLDEHGLPKTVFLPPPGPLSGTGPVIGIDLGTTNSCVALLSNGRPIVLRSREGYNTIPSVISLNAQNKLLVSHRAKNQLVLRPQHTIYGAKRLVGRPYDSAVVNQVRERFHYDIVPDSAGRAAVRLADTALSLEEVQAIILRECKEMAEAHLNQKVERAVVTVPAYYSEPQREAVRKSGILAGLKVERILNEPTSAALAYGLNRDLNKKVLVYDLGGGTFDATILKIEKNVFEVLGTGGDIFLGGIDFDNLIVDFLLARFQEKEGIAFTGDGIALSRVSDAAERAKMALSERNTFEVHIPMLMMDDAGRPRDLRVVMNRQELEKICEPLLSRTIDVVRDVLLDAKLKAAEVDDIILVGGMSRMPLVRDKLKSLFGKGPQASVNADEAVALGAALYSGSVDKVSSVVLIDVLPMTVGVAMPGGAFKRVIERNSPLPAQRSFAINTTKDNEAALELSIFQGEDNHISANEYLGTVRIEGLPKGPKGSVRVAVTLKLDSECVLHVEAREYSTRKEVKATLATRYSPEELQKQLQVSKESVKAAEERRGADLKERAGGFWGFVKKALGRK